MGTQMNKEDKRRLRNLKKNIKKLGHQKQRHKTKQLLNQDPTNDHLHEDNTDYGKLASDTLNGLDKDKTRKTDWHQST